MPQLPIWVDTACLGGRNWANLYGACRRPAQNCQDQRPLREGMLQVTYCSGHLNNMYVRVNWLDTGGGGAWIFHPPSKRKQTKIKTCTLHKEPISDVQDKSMLCACSFTVENEENRQSDYRLCGHLMGVLQALTFLMHIPSVKHFHTVCKRPVLPTYQ